MDLAPLRFPTLAAGLLAAVVSEAADAPYPLYLRNANPLLQTLGAPAMQGGELTPDGALAHRWVLNLANHADASVTNGEEVVLDGESYFLELALRYGLGSKLELGVDLPLVAHTEGVFDSLIEGWHDLVGLSNHERSGPTNMLRLFYQRNGVTEFDVDDPGAGLGDVRLTAAYSLAESDGRALAMRAQAELPTGDAEILRGNGAVDLSLVLDATDRHTFAGSRTSLFGRIGLVAPGDGDTAQRTPEGLGPSDQRRPRLAVDGADQPPGASGLRGCLFRDPADATRQFDEIDGRWQSPVRRGRPAAVDRLDRGPDFRRDP